MVSIQRVCYLKTSKVAPYRQIGTFLSGSLAHCGDVIMGAIVSQVTSLTIVYSTVYSDENQRKHQSSASLAFVREFTGDMWIPCTNGQLRGKCFHLSIGPSVTNFSEIWMEIRNFSFAKMRLKTSPAKWQPFCPGKWVKKWNLMNMFRCTYLTWPIQCRINPWAHLVKSDRYPAIFSKLSLLSECIWWK